MAKKRKVSKFGQAVLNSISGKRGNIKIRGILSESTGKRRETNQVARQIRKTGRVPSGLRIQTTKHPQGAGILTGGSGG